MKSITYYPGSFGEIIQGNYKGIDVLSSCPINRFTKVKIFETNKPTFKFNYPKSMEFLKDILVEWKCERYKERLDIVIESNIPEGKGFASSTADICGVYYSLLDLFNKRYNKEELVKNCIKVEPTDSIIFSDLNLFEYKKGKYIEKLGEYIEFNILVFEGKNIVNTVEFNKKCITPLKDISDLVKKLRQGIYDNDVKQIAYCSEESIIRNQSRLKYSILKIINSIKNEIGGYGIIGAHSGNALGIIYEGKINYNIIGKYSNFLEDYKIYTVKTLKNIF